MKFGFNKKIIAMIEIEIDNKNNAKFNDLPNFYFSSSESFQLLLRLMSEKIALLTVESF